MQAILLKVLKVVGSKLLMGLLQECVKELEKRTDNTVDKNDVNRVKEIAVNNVVKGIKPEVLIK